MKDFEIALKVLTEDSNKGTWSDASKDALLTFGKIVNQLKIIDTTIPDLDVTKIDEEVKLLVIGLEQNVASIQLNVMFLRDKGLLKEFARYKEQVLYAKKISEN